jgi:hypothetical protein
MSNLPGTATAFVMRRKPPFWFLSCLVLAVALHVVLPIPLYAPGTFA